MIHGLDAVPDFAKVFHAGAVLDGGAVKTSGGRVLCVCAKGADIREAQRRAYAAVATISWANERHRSDIGWRAVARESA